MNFVNDGWLKKCLEYDKWSHAGGSCLIVCLLWAVLKLTGCGLALWLVSAICFGIGIALEAWQGTHGIGFSWRDLVANGAGILIAYGAIGG